MFTIISTLSADRCLRFGRGRTSPQGLALSVVLFSVSSASAQTGAPISSTELIQNWKFLHDSDRTMRSYRVSHRSVLDPKKPPLLLTFKVRPDRSLMSATWQEISSTFSQSPDYSFLLWKTASNREWSLRRYEETPDASSQLEEATGELKAFRPLSTLFTIGQKGEKRDPTLWEVTQSPTFRFERITPQADGIDKIEFTYAGASGVALADRNRHSVVIHSTLRGGTNSPKSKPWVLEMKRREVEPEQDGTAPRCRLIEFTTANVGQPVGQHEIYEFSDYSDAPIPDEEFTLSHYGLPEPVRMEPRRRIPNSVWFLIAAAAFAAIALGLRMAIRGRNRGVAEKS